MAMKKMMPEVLVALIMGKGYARVEKIFRDAFDESKTLIDSMERYEELTRHYPARGLVDRIYRTRENLAWCKERGIRMNGPKLRRPPKDRQTYLEVLELERQESGERNEIEGCIGVFKRQHVLDMVMMRLKHTSEVDIHVSILTRNLFKRLKTYFWLVLGWVRRRGSGWQSDRRVQLEHLSA